MYNDLDIKCTFFDKCNKVTKLIDLARHEELCQKPVCWNFNNCEGYEVPGFSDKIPACSTVCVLMKAIVDSGNDQKKIY